MRSPIGSVKGGVLVNLRTNRIFELNATGMRAWELIGEGHTRGEIERTAGRGVRGGAGPRPHGAGDADRTTSRAKGWWMPIPTGKAADWVGPDQRTWHDDWVVAFDPDWAVHAAGPGAPRSPLSLAGALGSDLIAGSAPPIEVLFAGVLTNAGELDPTASLTSAAIVARLVATDGADAFARLRGPFAAIVWDGRTRRLFVARDQVGLQPLFIARSEGRWHFAGAPQPLVSLPGVSRAVDAVAFAEWICGWYPAIEDTAYRDVKRVPPATVTVFDGGNIEQRRYWDPSPITEPIAWSREEDLEAFEGLLTQAVRRAVGGANGVLRDISERRRRLDHDRGGGDRHPARGGTRRAPGVVARVSGRCQQRGSRCRRPSRGSCNWASVSCR